MGVTPSEPGSAAEPAPDHPSDEAAMAAIQAGRLDLLGLLYRRHSQRVFAQCLQRVADPAAAEDLVQETFLRVLRYRESFRGEALFTTWLFRIAANVCFDYLRSSGREVPGEEAVEEDVLEAPRSETATERLRILRTALDRLPEEKRRLLLMCRLQGLTYSQVADRLGAREGTVRVRVHRAVTELKRIFDSLWEEGS